MSRSFLRHLLILPLIAVAAALVARLLLDPLLDDHAPLLIFTFAVFVAAWRGGFWSGLLATGLSVVVGAYFFLPPRSALLVASSQNLLRILLFVIQGTLISVLAEQRLQGYLRLEQRVKERTEELQASKLLLEQMLELLPVGVWLLNEQGQIVVGNREGQRIWGSTKDTHVSEFGIYRGWWYETGQPVVREEWAVARAFLKGETVLNELVEIEALDGVRRILLNSALPLRNSEGQHHGVIVVNQEVTQAKQMEAELQEVRRRLEEGREAERLHLARELHDLPMQELHAAHFALTELVASLSEEAPHALAARAKECVLTANRMLRDLAQELRPPILERFGLAAAIEAHARQVQERYPECSIHLDMCQDSQDLPDWVELALFRIYQQALDNVWRHAQASCVSVALQHQDEHLVLEVQDDGQGFVVPVRWVELARQNHLGLVGAAERAAQLGGKFEVVSAPGAGTTVRVRVPLGMQKKM